MNATPSFEEPTIDMCSSSFVRACVCVRVFVCLWFVCFKCFFRRLSRTLVYVHMKCLSVNVRLHVRGVGTYVRARVY